MYVFQQVHTYVQMYVCDSHVHISLQMGTPEAGIIPDVASPVTPAESALDQAERKELWLFHSEKMPQVQHLVSPHLKREFINEFEKCRGAFRGWGGGGGGICPLAIISSPPRYSCIVPPLILGTSVLPSPHPP